MDDRFRKIDPLELEMKPFGLLMSDWLLITAGNTDSFNMMTASWGGFGVLWSRCVCWCVVKPQRYSRLFLEREESFTLSFFDEEYRSALELCGSRSGRELDKAAETGLTPISGLLDRTTAFAEARMILECRKVYYQDLDPAHFLDPRAWKYYQEQDYHRMYVGELVNCLVRAQVGPSRPARETL